MAPPPTQTQTHLQLPLLLHLLVETPASLTFLVTPAAQLPPAAARSPEARLVLRNLGGLLLATNLVCLAVLASLAPADAAAGDGQQRRLAASVCLCLGTYHVWPAYRAYARLRGYAGASGRGNRVLGGPVVHLVAHVLCFVALVGGGGAGILMG